MPEPGELGTILGIWAHPDDEVYLSGGIMAAAVRNGQRVVCVTATRGEEGSWDHERWPPEQMAAIRTEELARCLEVLGIKEHTFLEYRDGGCAAADQEEAAERVAAIVDEVAPDTILTFGPDGHTDHPDHIAVHGWATSAFRRAARSGASLYYTAVPAGYFDHVLEDFRARGVFTERTPTIVPPEELAIFYRLPPDLLEVKDRAIRLQVSQVEPLLATFDDTVDAIFRFVLEGEFYLLAESR